MTSEIITSALAVFAFFSASVTLGYITGRAVGNQRGRDEQWIENFFASEKQKREQREPNGRFKSKTK